MDKHFEVKEGSSLYDDYFSWKEDNKKVANVFNQIAEKYGIETHSIYPSKTKFHIVPEGNDEEKFNSMLKKTSYGEFKKNSEISKEWCQLVSDIKHIKKPQLFYYFNLIGHIWKEYLFDIDGKLYCRILSDGEVSVPDFVVEMKASEFHRIVEEFEKKQKEGAE